MGSRATQPDRRAMTRTGIYTGNSIDNRNIDIGIDLTKKSNVTVSIYQGGAGHLVIRYGETYANDMTKQAGTNVIANLIQALHSTGFQIGDHALINADEAFYRYLVFWEEP